MKVFFGRKQCHMIDLTGPVNPAGFITAECVGACEICQCAACVARLQEERTEEAWEGYSPLRAARYAALDYISAQSRRMEEAYSYE
jgi:hypothetical protein